MDELASDFFAYDSNIFFLVLVVEIELMVMLGNTQFTADALVAELTQANDFLW